MATNNGTLIKTYEILKMKNKNKVQFQKLTEWFQKIRKKLFEEWKLKYPSYYPLESCATDIVQLLKETQIEDEEFEFWKSWKIREIQKYHRRTSLCRLPYAGRWYWLYQIRRPRRCSYWHGCWLYCYGSYLGIL